MGDRKVSHDAWITSSLRRKLDSWNGSNKFHKRHISLSEKPLGGRAHHAAQEKSGKGTHRWLRYNENAIMNIRE